MKTICVAAAMAVGAALIALPARAQSVSYVPATENLYGTAPQGFVLSVFGPANLSSKSRVTVKLSVTSTVRPTGVTTTAAAAAVKLQTTSLTFTGPSQQANVLVTVTPPKTAGTYQWVILTTGWPSAVTNAGCVVNLLDVVGTRPVSTITYPSSGETLYVSGSPFSLGVPIGVEATSAAFPITVVQATATGPGLPSAGQKIALTSAGLGTTDAVSDGTLTVTQLGSYTVTYTATNAAGSSTATATFTVAVPAALPAITEQVVWSPTLAGATFPGGSVVPVSFTVVDTTTSNLVNDPNILVALYSISAQNAVGAVTVYSSSASPTYTVGSDLTYLVKWPTVTGSNHYRADVDRTVQYVGSTATTTTKLSSADFYTQ